MPEIFNKVDYSNEQASVYVNELENKKFKVTLGEGNQIVLLSKKQAKDLYHKLGIVLDK